MSLRRHTAPLRTLSVRPGPLGFLAGSCETAVFIIRLVIGLGISLVGVAVILLGIAFLFTIILIPVGLGIISAGVTTFVLGLALAGGTTNG